MKSREVLTFRDYLNRQELSGKYIILRHDVDRKPGNALRMAEIEKEFGIRSTYYFRMQRNTFKPEIIRQIVNMSHEVGYHYETLDKAKGDPQQAIQLFKTEIQEFRKVCDVNTICPHGNSLTRRNNQDIWLTNSVEDHAILGEASTVKSGDVFYFTDTGRTWNWKYRKKDVVRYARQDDSRVASTDDLIEFLHKHDADAVYINAHPERWNEGFIRWGTRLILEKTMNMVKRALFMIYR